MGIPVYFNTLIKNYSQDILYLDKQIINYLFLDLNCLIHPTCKNLTDQDILNEDQMIDDIFRNISKLVDYTNCTDLLYIAIDGVAPEGKMHQQKIRRYRTMYENKKWDTNSISPGTHFMNKLNLKLHKFIKTLSIDVLLSDSDQRGEGEHKILNYIKTNNLSGKICIYGLDADLIMLSLVSKCTQIYLLRETTEYNIENTTNDYIYLNIDKLKDILLNFLGYHKSHIIDDYIFICFLFGNDFINHIPTLNLRYNGYDILINVYKKLLNKYHGYFQLINLNSDNIIYWTFFKELIYELSLLENDILKKQHESRKYQRSKILNKYTTEFNHFKNHIDINNLSVNSINDYKISCNFDKDIINNMINDLPLLILNDSSTNYYNDKNKDINDYILSLIWCSHYYFKECINWKWSHKSHIGPFLNDLYTYLNHSNNDYKISYNNDEYTQKQQLEYILPYSSNNIHNFTFIKKDYNMNLDLRYKRYLWECDIIFVDI